MLFDKSEYLERLNKTKKTMQKKGLDVLITTDPSNMYYITGYDAWSFYVPQALIVALDLEEPIWFGRKQDANGAKITTYLKEENIMGYSEELIQAPPSHPFDELANILKVKNLDTKTIGVEMDSYYYTAESHHRLVTQCSNANFKDAYLLINWIRLVKSEKEIEYMKNASTLVEIGMKRAYDTIKPGIRQNEVAGNIQQSLIAGNENMGGEYSGLTLILASGIAASASHLTPSDKKFEQNEGTIIELSGVKNRYHCPLSRTVYIGKPSDRINDTMKITNESVENAIKNIQPGKTCHDVALAFWDVLNKYGLEKDSRCGYSIGIGYPPDWGEHTLSIRKNDMTILQPNVTFHLMAGMWMDTWGIEISESIRVTEKGCELFCNLSRDLYLI